MQVPRRLVRHGSGVQPIPARADRLSGAILAILVPCLLFGVSGCVTKFRTGAPLQPDQAQIVARDLVVAGVRAQREGAPSTNLPESAARLARLTGAPDQSSVLSDEDLAMLLESPSRVRDAISRLQSLADRVGHRYVLVGEAGSAPTDQQKSWIIQIVVPIPFIWISFGVPVNYASYADVPHATVSARVVDLRRGEVVAASFEVGSDLDPDETPDFANSAARRAIKLMALERP